MFYDKKVGTVRTDVYRRKINWGSLMLWAGAGIVLLMLMSTI